MVRYVGWLRLLPIRCGDMIRRRWLLCSNMAVRYGGLCGAYCVCVCVCVRVCDSLHSGTCLCPLCALDGDFSPTSTSRHNTGNGLVLASGHGGAVITGSNLPPRAPPTARLQIPSYPGLGFSLSRASSPSHRTGTVKGGVYVPRLPLTGASLLRPKDDEVRSFFQKILPLPFCHFLSPCLAVCCPS